LNEAPSDGCGGENDPCYSFPGATADGGYWSTTDGVTNAPSEINAWWPSRRGTFGTEKDGVGFARAVRGGASPSARITERTLASDPPVRTGRTRIPLR
jgi:hypothetical protein